VFLYCSPIWENTHNWFTETWWRWRCCNVNPTSSKIFWHSSPLCYFYSLPFLLEDKNRSPIYQYIILPKMCIFIFHFLPSVKQLRLWLQIPTDYIWIGTWKCICQVFQIILEELVNQHPNLRWTACCSTERFLML